MKDLQLYPSDKDCITGGKWLTDSIIMAGQKLLKMAHPNMGGLQPPVLGDTLAFEIQRGEFIQILNVSGSHWITVSNVGSQPGQINVYDSLLSGSIHSRTKKQIAAILFSPKEKITINFPAVQIQHGGNDCGLYALAFATSFCYGENPSHITYIQHTFHNHLLSCIEARNLTKFPTCSRTRKAQMNSQITFNIYCVCRLPESGRMICCSLCNKWYHDVCVNAPKEAWKKRNSEWFCDSCL